MNAHLSANSIGKGEGKIETEPIQASKQPASSASQLMKIPGGIDGRNLASAPSPLPSIPFPPQETLQTRRSGEGKRKIEIGRGRTLEKESHGGLERGKQLQASSRPDVLIVGTKKLHLCLRRPESNISLPSLEQEGLFLVKHQPSSSRV